MTDPYSVLGVDPDADNEKVKEAYRELAKKHHPDRGGDEEKFKEVQQAYDQITSEDGGARSGSAGPAGFGTRTDFDFGGKDKGVEEFIEDFHEFASKGGFNRRGFQGSPFEEAKKQANRQREVLYKLPIEFDLAVNGGKVEAVIDGQQNRQIQVPPGVKNGAKVSYSGNLKVKFDVQPSDTYWRKNDNDIYKTETVSALDAMAGTEIETQTIEGETVKLNIDPGSNPGSLFRLPGKGGPETYNGTSRGDMYVKLAVEVPEITSEEGQELIEKLKS